MEGDELLEADAHGLLDLSKVIIRTSQMLKIKGMKLLINEVKFFEYNGEAQIETVRELCFETQSAFDLSCIEDIKDAYIESLLIQIFLALGRGGSKYKVRFFKLASDKSQDISPTPSYEEGQLVIKMEKFLRPRFFDMMNSGRKSYCFLIIEFDETLIVSIHASRLNGQLSIHLLDKLYEEIKIRSSSQQAIVDRV